MARLLLQWLLILAASLPLSAQPPPGFTAAAQSSEERFQRARDLYLEDALEESRSILTELIPELDEAGRGKMLGDSLNILCLIEIALGNYPEGLGKAREAARVRRVVQDWVGVARSTNNAGLALQYMGRYEESLAAYRDALAQDRANGDPEGEVLRLNNIANVYFFQARYVDALHLYQEGLSRLEEFAGADWYSGWRHLTVANLAALHQKLGQYQRALELYSSLRVNETGLSPREDALILSNQGALYRHLGDPIAAIEQYEAALQLFRRQRDADGELSALKNLGIVHAMDTGRFDQAIELFSRVLRFARRSGNRREQAQAHLYLGETSYRLGVDDEAMKHFRAAIEMAVELGALEDQWKASFGLGRSSQRLGDPAAARRHYEQALGIIESASYALKLGSLRQGFLTATRGVYDALIGLDLSEGPLDTREQLDQLGRRIERARSRMFQERFASALTSRQGARDPETAARRREVRAQISNVWSRQLTAPPEAQLELRASLARLEDEYLRLESLGQQLQMEWPGLSAIQKALPDKGLLLNFWLGGQRLALLWVTPTDAGVVVWPFEAGPRELLASCIESLAMRDGSDESSCSEIAPQLMEPIEPLLDDRPRHVMIVPDGNLGRFPFETLRRSNGHYLIEDFEVSYHVSVLSLVGRRKDTSPPPKQLSLLAIGNPETGEGAKLVPLPFAALELGSVADELPIEAEVLEGHNATKSRFKSSIETRRPTVIHLATHAQLNLIDAERSRIQFAPEEKASEADYLFLAEVLSLDLECAELVTLSACETAVADTEGRAGVDSFSRAFLVAGAETTVATLWPVSDEGTAQFMREFYAELAKGRGRAVALRAAKLRFLRSNTSLAAPYYWAPFVLYGEGSRPLSLPPAQGWPIWIVLGAVLIAATILMLVVWRTRRSHGR